MSVVVVTIFLLIVGYVTIMIFAELGKHEVKKYFDKKRNKKGR